MKNITIVIILSILLLSDALPVFNQLPTPKYIYNEPTATSTPPAQQPYNVVGSSGDEDCNNEHKDDNLLIVTSNTINTIINKLHTVLVPLNNTVQITWSKCIADIGGSESVSYQYYHCCCCCYCYCYYYSFYHMYHRLL